MELDDVFNELNFLIKREDTGDRSGDLYLSKILRKVGDTGKIGFICCDVDFIIYNYKKNNIMLLENKSHGSDLRKGQRMLFLLLDKIFKEQKRVIYVGFFQITFENSTFEDGKCYLTKPFDGEDRFEILNEEHLLSILRKRM